MPRLIAAALLASLIFAACTAGQGPSTVVAPTAAPQADRSEGMQSQATTRQPEAETIPRPTATPATASDPTVAAGFSPTLRLEAATTSAPMPAGVPTTAPTEPGSTWRGITIAPEERCAPYDSDDYPYSPSVEPRIVEELGGVYGPYTGNWFGSIRETDIEHIVARSEAHDSGLCAATPATRAQFASDLVNLTLASPKRQPAPEGGQGCRRMASRSERVLVCEPHRPGPPGIRPHHRRGRGGCNRPGPGRVRVNRDGGTGARSINDSDRSSNTRHRPRGGRPRPVGRQRQREDNVRGSARSRYRTGTPRAPRIRVYERRRRGRHCVRIERRGERGAAARTGIDMPANDGRPGGDRSDLSISRVVPKSTAPSWPAG